MAKFYEVKLMSEGCGILKLNEDHIVAIKKREVGGYRVWLSIAMPVGDDPDRLLVLAGTSGEQSVSVLNVISTELDVLFS